MPSDPTPDQHPLVPQTPADRIAAAEAGIKASQARIRALRAAHAAAQRQSAAPRKRKPAGALCRDVSATGWTADKQRAFLEHLATHGCVNQAAAYVGLSKQAAYALRRRAGRSMFALAWEVAVRTARKALLDEAFERAFAGREVPVWYRGEPVGTRIVHNDRLVMQLLAHKFEPLPSDFDEATLTQLWPVMLAQIDAEIPLDAAALLRRRKGDQDENGNDDEE